MTAISTGRRWALPAVLATAALAAAGWAMADDDKYERGSGGEYRGEYRSEKLSKPSKHRAPLLPLYKQECGSCHVAYPPALLPASSWARLMNGLDKHYGSDAALDDPAVAQELAVWLQTNAGSGKRAAEAPPEDRITRGRWFVREHDEVSPATWKLPAVKSPANCSACHTRAEDGSYREREIRVPKSPS